MNRATAEMLVVNFNCLPAVPLQMALRPAVELSYLTEDEQNALLEIMDGEDCTPSHAQAIKIRNFSEKGNLDSHQAEPRYCQNPQHAVRSPL